MRGMFGAMWEVDDPTARHFMPYADDFVVAPAHRNRGVASQVMQASVAETARRGFPFAVSLSAGPVTFVGSLATGWRSAGAYQSVWRDSAWSPPLRRRLDRLHTRAYGRLKLAFDALHPAGPFARLDRGSRHITGPLSLRRAPRAAEMAALVARLPWDGRIRHVRDADYLAWRFGNPLHDYRFLFWDDGGLQGYLVLQRYVSDRADRGCVNIVDWEASSEAIRTGLLTAALRAGRFTRLHTWTVSASEPLRILLRDQGFVAVEPAGVQARRGGLLVRRLDAANRDAPWMLGSRSLLRIAEWDLRMLYSMAG
jgi:hypothetical protein